MVGLMLLFVGGVLLVNGMGGLGKVEAKSMAIMNFMVGGLALFVALLSLIRAEAPGDYFAVCAYVLFSFTYLYVAISLWLDLDMMSFKSGDPRFGVFWLIWGALWFMFYLANVPKKDFGKLLPYSVISIGVLTCWVPGLLILTENW